MSHKPNVFSPPGTPILDRTAGELVAERPGRSRVFQTFRIDFKNAVLFPAAKALATGVATN
jgi:hypothetical protein